MTKESRNIRKFPYSALVQVVPWIPVVAYFTFTGIVAVLSKSLLISITPRKDIIQVKARRREGKKIEDEPLTQTPVALRNNNAWQWVRNLK